MARRFIPPPENAGGSDRKWQEVLDLLWNNDIEKATQICSVALYRFSDEARWHLGLAWAEMAQSSYRKALDAAETAVEMQPENPAVFRTCALILVALGRGEDACEAARSAVRMEPSDVSRKVLRLATKSLRRPSPGEEIERAARDLLIAPARRQGRSRRRDETLTKTGFTPLQPALEQQLQALYGSTLFGSWRINVHVTAAPGIGMLQPAEGSSRRWPLLVALLVGLLLLALGGYGYRASSQQRAQQTSNDLLALLRKGSMTEIPEHLQALEALSVGFLADEQHSDVVARAHAALYRYHDATPEHLEKARAWIRRSPPQSDQTILAKALLQPAAALVQGELRGRLEEIAAESKDPSAAFLLACALQRQGHHKQALVQFDRAEALEPAHLPNLATIVVFHFRRGKRVLAANLLEQMRSVSPDSPWTKLAQAQLAPRKKQQREGLQTLLDASAGAPRIVRAQAALQLALRAEGSQAGEYLDRFVELTDGGRLFMLDGSSDLQAAGNREVARMLAAIDDKDPGQRGKPDTKSGRP